MCPLLPCKGEKPPPPRIQSDRGTPTNSQSTEMCLDAGDHIREVAPQGGETRGMPGVLFLKVKMWLRKVRRDKALMVDIFSRGLFPAVFLVFNLFYWVYYLQ